MLEFSKTSLLRLLRIEYTAFAHKRKLRTLVHGTNIAHAQAHAARARARTELNRAKHARMRAEARARESARIALKAKMRARNARKIARRTRAVLQDYVAEHA